MKIARIEAYPLTSSIDPPQERPFHSGVRRIVKRDFVLVVVETADGEVGYAPGGASSSAMREYFDGESKSSFAELLSGRIASVLEGNEFETIQSATDRITKLDLPPIVESQSVASIDVALHDIKGKRHDVPIYELLGGDDTITETLDLYASAGMYMSPEEYATQARSVSDEGFVGYKYRPGIGPEGDCRTIRMIRDAVPGHLEIMVDAHTWWKLGDDSYGERELMSIYEDFEAHDVFWLEEPVQPDDYDGYIDLAGRTTLPLAAGESEPTVEDLIALANTGVIDFLQGDVRHHCGFTGCLEVMEHCRETDIQFVPHQFGTLLGLVANAHLVAAGSDTDLLEYPIFEGDPAIQTDPDPGMYPYPLAFDILQEPLDVSDGRLAVPDGPGLGVDVDMSVIEEYQYVEGPWTEFSYAPQM